MLYWNGRQMNWPLTRDWKCEICGKYSGLEWGMINGECRCNNCHTPYFMKDKADNIVATPICMLKKNFYQPAIDYYKTHPKPLDTFEDDDWIAAGVVLTKADEDEAAIAKAEGQS